MASGYFNNGVPDDGWWMEQIHAGVEWRKKVAHEGKWDTWRKYYRGEWVEEILPVNIFFSMLRTIVPRVYFRNPAVSITPAMPGFLEMAFAQVMNRVDNKMIRQMSMKSRIKMMVQDTFMFGTGAGKLGFGAQFTPSPEGLGGTEAPREGARRERFEYDPNVFPNMPWFGRVHTGTLIVPENLDSIQNARWVAQWIRRPLDDVRRDPRLKNTRDLKASSRSASPGIAFKESTRVTPVDMVDMVEIRDAKFQTVILIAPHAREGKRILFNGPDRIQEMGIGFPIHPLVFNPDEEHFWGVPDAQILEPMQLELNEIRTLTMKHRRLSVVKLLYRDGFIDEEEVDKMLSEDVGAAIRVKGTPSDVIDKMTTANIPADLVTASTLVMQDIRDVLGFSRNQMGEFQSRRGDTSATEAAIVQQASELRLDERRDAVSDLLTNVVRQMNEVLFEFWTREEVLEVVGPGGLSVWVKFDPSMLKHGHYHVRIDPDTATPRTRAQREAKALVVYNTLKQNPLIDPMKLTQYLLREVEGTELDDLMAGLPPPENAPRSPLNMGQFAELLQTQTRRAQNGGGRPLLPAGR